MSKKMLASFITCILLMGQSCWGGIMLTLTSPNDLSNINVGDVVQFDVTLSGLDPGDSLDLLSADLIWSSSLLGLPTVSAGSIIPVIDIAGFDSSASGAGRASAFYDVSIAMTSPLTSNGQFFSFSVTALAAGSGTIGFDPISPPVVLLTSGSSPFADTSADLPYSIHGTQAVPEVSSLYWAAFMLMAMCGWSLRTKLHGGNCPTRISLQK